MLHFLFTMRVLTLCYPFHLCVTRARNRTDWYRNAREMTDKHCSEDPLTDPEHRQGHSVHGVAILSNPCDYTGGDFYVSYLIGFSLYQSLELIDTSALVA